MHVVSTVAIILPDNIMPFPEDAAKPYQDLLNHTTSVHLADETIVKTEWTISHQNTRLAGFYPAVYLCNEEHAIDVWIDVRATMNFPTDLPTHALVFCVYTYATNPNPLIQDFYEAVARTWISTCLSGYTPGPTSTSSICTDKQPLNCTCHHKIPWIILIIAFMYFVPAWW